MNLIYTGQTCDNRQTAHENLDMSEVAKARGSIFLAGPTPRVEHGSFTPESWRPQAIKVLEAYRFEGIVYVPEHPPEGAIVKSTHDQIAWEWSALEAAHVIAFWVPREMKYMPALTTNIEFGTWMKSGKVVFGAPEGAEHTGYMRYACEHFKIPSATMLEATMHHAVLMNTLGLRDAQRFEEAVAAGRSEEVARLAKEAKARRARVSP